MIDIDGSQGEGGGQIIRSSLALSAVTGRPLRIFNIRAGRKKPGLKKQHVVAANAAARICNAHCKGVEIGASEITFEPNPICAGHYEFQIGSAGSTSLVSQTVLPALLTADGKSTLVIEGGTHNPMAPTFDFIQQSYLPQLAKFGANVDSEIERMGFFPKGGGRVSFEITPVAQWQGHELLESGVLKSKSVTALVSALPANIGTREVDKICRKVGWPANVGKVIEVQDPHGPGNVVSIALDYENVCAMFTGFGQRGVKAEQVANSCYRDAKRFLDAQIPVEEYLADQLILPMSLAANAGCKSSFRTYQLSGHSVTHLDVVKLFLDIKIETMAEENGTVAVQIGPFTVSS